MLICQCLVGKAFQYKLPGLFTKAKSQWNRCGTLSSCCSRMQHVAFHATGRSTRRGVPRDNNVSLYVVQWACTLYNEPVRCTVSLFGCKSFAFCPKHFFCEKSFSWKNLFWVQIICILPQKDFCVKKIFPWKNIFTGNIFAWKNLLRHFFCVKTFCRGKMFSEERFFGWKRIFH